jgi:hypothetical protein
MITHWLDDPSALVVFEAIELKQYDEMDYRKAITDQYTIYNGTILLMLMVNLR